MNKKLVSSALAVSLALIIGGAFYACAEDPSVEKERDPVLEKKENVPAEKKENPSPDDKIEISSPIKDPGKFVEDHESVVNKALSAYNGEDLEKFYENFVKTRTAFKKRMFESMWIGGYKNEFGNFVSKKLVLDKCDFNALYPLLVYKSVFEKDKNVEIKAVFAEEKGAYKLFYLRFDKIIVPARKPK